jgi:hypothetical protein
MGVHAVELTPATLAPVLPEGEEEEEGVEGDEKGNAQLAELPEGLRALAGEVRELAVRSTRLAVVPGWVGELTRLETLEVVAEARPPALFASVIVMEYERNALLKSLPGASGS